MRRSGIVAGASGGIMVVIALAAMVVAPATALRAWLATAFLWSGVPIGSLGLLMMIRLIGGRWGHALSLPLEAGALTLPIGAAAFAPVLIAMRWLYPWVGAPLTGFKGAWLMPLPFVLRTVLLFAGLGAFVWLLVGRRGSAVALSSAGLLFLVPMTSLVAIDWIVSLDRDFHSSGFGLYALSIQFSVALAVATWILLGRQPNRTATLGALMMTLVLISLYLAFTNYFIVWSGDLAPLVGWYGARGSGGWGAAYALVVAIELVVFFALLLPMVRDSARWLRAMAAAIVAAKAIEAAWLVLPQGRAVSGQAVILFVIAATGMGLLVVLAQNALIDRRMAQRVPHGG